MYMNCTYVLFVYCVYWVLSYIIWRVYEVSCLSIDGLIDGIDGWIYVHVYLCMYRWMTVALSRILCFYPIM